MWTVLKRDPATTILITQLVLEASSAGGLRQREWDPELVKRALDVRGATPASRWLEYNWYTDTGQFQEAETALEWWLRQPMARADQAMWRYEAAWFEALSKNNLTAAREHLKSAEDLRVDGQVAFSAWKARAAIAARESRFTDAAFAASQAERAACRSVFDLGIAKGTSEDLHQLLSPAEPPALAFKV